MENWEKKHEKPSEELGERPEIQYSLRWIWTGFWELCATRQSSGFGPCAILLTEIEAYCRINEIDELREFTYHICRMDVVWREEISKPEKNDGDTS